MKNLSKQTRVWLWFLPMVAINTAVIVALDVSVPFIIIEAVPFGFFSMMLLDKIIVK